MKRKACAVFCLLLFLFGAACRSIWNVSGGEEYVAAVRGQSVYKLDVASSRGTLYDCKLRPLTGGSYRLTAAVAPTIETIGALEKATDGKYRRRLALALEDGKPFLMELTASEAGRLRSTPGIDLFRVPQRYEENQLAPHVVGYLDSMGSGASGAELAMNDALEKSSGHAAVYYQVDALGRVMAGGDREIVDTVEESAAGAVLTLDEDIQSPAEESAALLGKGAVVVTEVPNCEVRALVSLPSYSPLHIGDAVDSEDAPLINRAFSAYAPGSVFKLVSAAAALEADSVVKEFTCTGSLNAGGMLFHCYNGDAHGEVNLQTALEKSCNCYFINTARSLGAQPILNMAYNLGLGTEVEFGRGLFSAAGSMPDAEALENARALANFSFGQGDLAVTPVQMCGLINAIASGGVYSTPKLIEGTVDKELELTPAHSIADKNLRVMGDATARTLRQYMESTLKNGTGKPGAPDNCTAGVKTGTAQTGRYYHGQELLHFWYCGYVCDGAGSPRYCVSVLAESTPDDNGAAAQVFREVCEGLGKLMAAEAGKP